MLTVFGKKNRFLVKNTYNFDQKRGSLFAYAYVPAVAAAVL